MYNNKNYSTNISFLLKGKNLLNLTIEIVDLLNKNSLPFLFLMIFVIIFFYKDKEIIIGGIWKTRGKDRIRLDKS